MTKKHSRSTAKKQLEVSPTAKKPVEQVACTSKKQVEEASTSKKQKKQQPPPPPAESQEAELDSSSEEEEDEPTDSGNNPQSPPPVVTATSDSESPSENENGDSDSETEPAPPPPPVVTATSDSESPSENENGDSDSETEPAPPPPPVVTATSDSESPPENENGDSDSETELAPPAPEASSSRKLRKRTIVVTASPSKRAKSETETDTAKKALSFQRVWTEEDEVELLQALLEFKEETGKNPSEDLSGIYKDSVSFNGKSYSQFSSKVRKLKSKYFGKIKSGVEPNYTKDHDLKCSDLCKKIWVSDVVSAPVVKPKKKKVEVEVKVTDDSVRAGDGVKGESDWFESSYLVGAIKALGVLVDDDSLKWKWSLVPVEMKKKLEAKFKFMLAKDFELARLKTMLLREVSSAIATA